MSWISQSFIAMLVMAGYSMMIPFMLKNFNVPGFTTVTLWMLGASTGLIFLKGSLSFPSETPSPSILVMGVIVLIGFVFGTIMNLTITNALIDAPNPAYPMTILNMSAAVVMILSAVAYVVFSKYFPEASISGRGVAGFLAVTVGGYLISTA